jgi:hypothetical protein
VRAPARPIWPCRCYVPQVRSRFSASPQRVPDASFARAQVSLMWAPKEPRHVAWGVSPRSTDSEPILSPEGATAAFLGAMCRRPSGAFGMRLAPLPGARAPGYMPLPLVGQIQKLRTLRWRTSRPSGARPGTNFGAMCASGPGRGPRDRSCSRRPYPGPALRS